MPAPQAQQSPGLRVEGGTLGVPPTALDIQGQGWRTLDEIAGQLGVPRREVEQLIEGWRLAGKPIVAGPKGVRWTENPDELEQYVEARRRRMASIYLGSRALRRTLRRMRERTDLVLWSDVA